MAKKAARRKRATLVQSQAAEAVAAVRDDAAARAELIKALVVEIGEGVRAQQALSMVAQPGAPTAGAGMAAMLSSVSSAPSFKIAALKELATQEPTTATTLIDRQTIDAQETVNLYSLVASGIGLLPGLGLSFVGVFATQVLMVQKIAECYGRDLSNSKATTAITALLGTGFGEGIGGGLRALTASAFPGSIGGVLGVVAGPVATYAACQAVGSVFISAFQNENRQVVTQSLAGHVQNLMAPMRAAAAAAKTAA